MMYVSVIVFIVFVYMTLFRIVRYFNDTITKNGMLKIFTFYKYFAKILFVVFFILL